MAAAIGAARDLKAQMPSFHGLRLSFPVQLGRSARALPASSSSSFICAVSMGFEKLQGIVEKWEGLAAAALRHNLKLLTDRQTYEAVDELARLQNKTAHQLAMEIVRNFVAVQQNGKATQIR